jgi:tetratricopeptide (TPR) repeat protein
LWALKNLGENVEKEDVVRMVDMKNWLGNLEQVRSGGVRALLATDLMSSHQLVRGLSGVAVLLAAYPFLVHTLYQNFFFAGSLLLFFSAWVLTNWQLGRFSKSTLEGERQRRVLLGMVLTLVLGIGSLLLYEIKMPKYEVALINKELYRVPPQLSKKQLIELGTECNTYGNTLCSHDVFAKIVRLDPRDYNALANLAMAQSHLGFHQQAVINFQRAIARGVRTQDVLRFYGKSLKELGHVQEAQKVHQMSLKLNPKHKILKERLAELEY